MRLSRDEVHVWVAPLGRPERDVRRLWSLLSSEERERAGAFPLAPRKRRYAVRQAIVREILARYAGVAPETLKLTRSARGKPALPTGPLFSVADSDNLALVAVASCEVGADLERVVDRPLARRLDASGGGLERFYERWTAREARAKALDRALWSPHPDRDVDCRRIDVGPGFVAMLATRGRVPRVETRRWTR